MVPDAVVIRGSLVAPAVVQVLHDLRLSCLLGAVACAERPRWPCGAHCNRSHGQDPVLAASWGWG
jgi:hypothetical protein